MASVWDTVAASPETGVAQSKPLVCDFGQQNDGKRANPHQSRTLRIAGCRLGFKPKLEFRHFRIASIYFGYAKNSPPLISSCEAVRSRFFIYRDSG